MLTPYRVIAYFLVSSLLFYLVFVNEIVPVEVRLVDSKVTEYRLMSAEFGKSASGKLAPVVLSLICLVLSGPILFGITIYNIFVFKKYVSNKKSISASSGTAGQAGSTSKANDNLTTMLIFISLMYAFGNVPFSVYYSITKFAPTYTIEAMAVGVAKSPIF